MNLSLVSSIFIGSIFIGGFLSHRLNLAGIKTFERSKPFSKVR
jgi:hypothetical protein